MSKRYMDILNNYIEMNEFLTVVTKNQDEYVFNEINATIDRVMGVHIEPKRLEEWVKQSMFIEKFTVDQLRDFALDRLARRLLKEKDDEIAEFKDKVEKVETLEKALELACERIKYFEQQQDIEMGHRELFGYDIDYDVSAIVENYINDATEMLKNG